MVGKENGMPRTIRPRLGVGCFLLIFLWLLLVGRLGTLQVVNGRAYSEKAERQNEERITVEAGRGDILDRNHQILAASLEVSSIYALGYQIENSEKAARQLAKLGLGPKGELRSKLAGTKGFCWLKRAVSEKTGRRIEEARIPGVYRCRDAKRYYPRGRLAGNLLGFAGDDGGLEGVEYRYNDLLGGVDGWAVLQRHPGGDLYPFPEYPRSPPKRGKDLVLTIDADLQEIVEEELERTISAYRAKGGVGILLNPKNGEILVMANSPGFNPNLRKRKKNPEIWKNRAIADLFEPGSTFKVVMATAALAKGVVARNELLPVSDCAIEISGVRIKDPKKHGDLSFEEVIWRSSNVGAVKVADRVGKDDFYVTTRALGFGCKTGIDLPGEAEGHLPPPESWSPLKFANLAFGQGISATALQLALAYSAIANGGVLVEPQIVKMVLKDGQVVHRSSPQVVRRVVPEEIAEAVREILTGVVERGTAMGARIEGIEIAGKTGTAQKSNGAGGYEKNAMVASFVGFFPARDPSFLLCLVVDEPRGIRWGGDVAASLFKRILRRIRHIEPYRDLIFPPQDMVGM